MTQSESDRLNKFSEIVFNDFKEGNENRLLHVYSINENEFSVTFGAGDAESLKGIKLKAGYQFCREAEDKVDNGEYTKVIYVKMTGAKRGKALLEVNKAVPVQSAKPIERKTEESEKKEEPKETRSVNVIVPTAENKAEEPKGVEIALTEEQKEQIATASEHRIETPTTVPTENVQVSEKPTVERIREFVEKAETELSKDMEPQKFDYYCKTYWAKLMEDFGSDSVLHFVTQYRQFEKFLNCLSRRSTGENFCEVTMKEEREEPAEEAKPVIDADKPVSPSIGQEWPQKTEEEIAKEMNDALDEAAKQSKEQNENVVEVTTTYAGMKDECGDYKDEEWGIGTTRDFMMRIISAYTLVKDMTDFMVFVEDLGEEGSDHLQILLAVGAVTLKDEYKKAFFDYANEHKWGIVQYVDAPTKGDLESRAENKDCKSGFCKPSVVVEAEKQKAEEVVAVEQKPNHEDKRNFEDEDFESIPSRKKEMTLKEKLNACRSFLPQTSTVVDPDGECREQW